MYPRATAGSAALVALATVLSACRQTTPTLVGERTPPSPGWPEHVTVDTRPTGAVTLPEVDPSAVTGDIIIAGSSTVYPLTERMAELFREEGYGDNLSIDSVGTGAGFERFCVAAEIDIANASRPISEEERDACEAKGRPPLELRVGTDALAVVVSQENDFASGVTKEQLAMVYSGQARTWADLRPDWPAERIQLFSPGTDSGTFDYFVEVIFDGDESLMSAAAQMSEDDNVIVQGVLGGPYAIGYLGYAYFREKADRLKALAVDGVEPTQETAESNEYPLSRPLFLYSSAPILQSKPQVAAFINYYLTYVNDEIIDVGYFPASSDAHDSARQALLDSIGP
jgi:phosphate binding protein